MVGHLLQYHPICRHLQKLVQDGATGALRYVYSNRMSMGKLRTEEDVIRSFAPHDVSMVLGLTGEASHTITAHGATIVSDELADRGHLHMIFPSGLKTHIFVSCEGEVLGDDLTCPRTGERYELSADSESLGFAG
jgi:UDP-2-acetamido-3-amino-2,3-dideoxy-glucuronate N-acetyltransferase